MKENVKWGRLDMRKEVLDTVEEKLTKARFELKQ